MAPAIYAIWLALLLFEVAMPPRPSRLRPPSITRVSALDVLHPDAAGIDIGSDFHVVAIALPGTDLVEVRSFGACTADLIALSAWLTQHGVKIERCVRAATKGELILSTMPTHR